MLPPGVARRAVTTLSLSAPAQDAMSKEGAGGQGNARSRALLSALGGRQKQVVSLLEDAPRQTLTIGRLKRRYTGPSSGLDTALRSLEREGLVTREVALPSPRSRPQTERIIRLATEAEEARSYMNAQSQRAPLQAAALDWLLKRSAQSQRRVVQSVDVEEFEPKSLAEGWLPLSELYLHTGATSSTVSRKQSERSAGT